jgi:hypothetical protein
VSDKPYPPNLARLLREQTERPSNYRGAYKGNELPTPHCLPHARTRQVPAQASTLKWVRATRIPRIRGTDTIVSTSAIEEFAYHLRAVSHLVIAEARKALWRRSTARL